ncbi:DUF3750 domain-containing protein [Orrella daihaiensis]|uniref:DUF3750 domain-containing protein n=1 Tax=Orrella daihaiensis TaxID=2782176 RepID=A0ABY4ALJ3_9BURK|nr:DUF3750 domain-containing protein [Orrella daihaiensis]UOD50285.1 DUF3750 domain-containing protein [Orrella daihaiensis]
MKLLYRILLIFLLLVTAAAAIKWWQDGERIAHAQTLGWYQLPREATNLLPAPETTKDAVVAVLAAPTYGWRGYFAVHPWLVYKRAGETTYTRHEVIGWGRTNVVRRNHARADGQWYGATPKLLVLHRGPVAENMIPDIERAIASYPYAQTYRSYPGPNSNTFLAHIGRSVPALDLDLPPTAIGKDYRPLDDPFGSPPSGRGIQLSLEGLLGLIASPQEGFEFNLLGLGVGVDFNCPALRLPFVGRLGFDGTIAHNGCRDVYSITEVEAS